MDKILTIQNSKQDLLLLSPEEILYIKSDGNYCSMLLYGRTEPIELWENLKNLLETIDSQMRKAFPKLVRIGKQYILNIDYINRIDTKKDTITLWRKGMNEPVVLDGISHKALLALTNALLNDKR